MSPITYRLTSSLLHVNRPSHPRNAAFSNSDLKFKVEVMREVKTTVQWVSHQSNRPSHPWDTTFYWQCLYFCSVRFISPWCCTTTRLDNMGLPMGQKQTLRNTHFWNCWVDANRQMTMTFHSLRSRQFHKTSNGEIPSSGRKYPSRSEGWGVKTEDTKKPKFHFRIS